MKSRVSFAIAVFGLMLAGCQSSNDKAEVKFNFPIGYEEAKAQEFAQMQCDRSDRVARLISEETETSGAIYECTEVEQSSTEVFVSETQDTIKKEVIIE